MRIKLASRNILGMTLLVAMFSIFSSCQKTAETSTSLTTLEGETSNHTTVDPTCNRKKFCLLAGQLTPSGNVLVYNDSKHLYVHVVSTEGYQQVKENIKLWVGDDLANLPVSGGGAPIAGKFPFKVTILGNQISYIFKIPFEDIQSTSPINCDSKKLHIFLHVDGISKGKAETAWGGCLGEGVNIKGPGRWYYSMDYTTACCATCGCN